jgi:MFS family permease
VSGPDGADGARREEAAGGPTGTGLAEPVGVGVPEPPSPAPRRRWAIDLRPLRVPPYRRLWLGSGVSVIGFQFTAVAVPTQMFTLTGESFWVGLLGLAALVPLLIFGLWGGAVADAVDRRRLLLVSSTLTWLTTLALFGQALLRLRNPVLLLVLVAV